MAYEKKTENLFRKEMVNFDVLVNAILWDTGRTDHIVYKDDLRHLKKGCLIIDISCDRNGGVETSIPTTIENPTYMVDGIRHYVVDHTPALFWKTTSESLSEQVAKFVDFFVEGNMQNNQVLSNCHIFENGTILDDRIKTFQKR